jgi:hypothetical protein
MEDRRSMEATSDTRTAARGICDECGKTDVLTARVDPESPLSDTVRLCPACARAPEPFWHDEP